MSISQKGHRASMSHFDANTLFSSDKKCGNLEYIIIFLILVIIAYLLHKCWSRYQKHIIEPNQHKRQ